MFRTDAIGHIGNDATVSLVNGKSVINFNIAYTEKFKDQSGTDQSKTTWVHCNWWTEKTAIVPLLKKGQKVLVSGKIETKIYLQEAQLHLRISSLYLV
jgi:single-strand DNA-binding protein